MRRLFVGDLHGCLDELDELLEQFSFRPGQDRLFSVGDVMGKGPKVLGLLHRLKELNASVVRGNHDELLLRIARGKKSKEASFPGYLDDLGNESVRWIDEISSWPLFLELEDIIVVHAGLQPGKSRPEEMDPRVLLTIRTWDGKGDNLSNPGNPPWYRCVSPGKTIVFGHWAAGGIVDLPRFKGLDSGCVYGRALSAWCPEEDRFYQVASRRVYAPILP